MTDYLTWYSMTRKSRLDVGDDRVTFGVWQFGYFKKSQVVIPGGGTPLFGLYGDVPLDEVWFSGLTVLNRVYNLTWLCPKEGQNLS